MSEVEPIVFDFTRIDEGFMTIEATKLKLLMNALFTGSYFPVQVRGNPMQIDRFTRALAAEKDYVAAFNNYGLNNPATYRSRYKLDSAVRKFERDTGLVWPIK
mgnify:CR=1 FL=1